MYQVKEINDTKVKNVGLFYDQELQKISLPFDSFEIVKELDNDKILVKKLNNEKDQNEIVDKSTFLSNQYSFRKRKPVNYKQK